MDDGYVRVALLIARCGRFADLIDEPGPPAEFAALRAAETIGRPMRSHTFLDAIARQTGRDARPRKRGRKNGI